MPDTPHLLASEADGILIATLNRPEKLNAITEQMMRLLGEALVRLRDTAELKVMLIRSTGRYFCSGVDLRDSKSRAPVTTGSAMRLKRRTQLHGMQAIYDEMERIEKPIVVAHHAMCMGGGFEMSLSCDFRLAAKSAAYAFPEGLFGSIPASNGVSRLTRICGTHWARYLVMANKSIDADQALNIGLVHEVYQNEAFEAEVMNFCRHLASQTAEQMGVAKLAIEMAKDVGLAQARNVESLAASALMLNPGYSDGFERHLATIGKRGRKA